MSSRPDQPPRALLALDYGLRRIGVATASCITGTASALETITNTGQVPNWERLDHIIREWSPELIVLGLPSNLDGSESEMTVLTRQFADLLKSRVNIPIEFVDERYTSVEAEAILKEQRRQGIRNKKLKKADVDAVAAQLIAESWMNAARPS